MTQKEIIKEALKKGISYEAYRDMIDSLLQEGKTTGENHSEAMIHYTEMNVQRMNKWDKRFTPSDEVLNVVKSLDEETWLLITEGWCGDAAHSVPVIAAIAERSNNVNLQLVLRDENLELMDQYLTNGGRGIPKLIRMNTETLEVLSTWGPRPREAQDMVLTAKSEGREYSDFVKDVQIWYARNRGLAIQEELLESLSKEVL